MARFIRLGSALAVGLSTYSSVQTSPIYNDSPKKRNFYEDESTVVPVPGTVIPASGTELEILGENRLIDGISVRSPATLESFFKSARNHVAYLYNSSLQWVDKSYNHYHETEHKITSTVSELHSKKEDLLPNGIYVIIAALSGNIAARQRGILAKATFPVVLGVASFKYFLPETFDRTSSFVWKLEQNKLPHLAETQVSAVNKSKEFVEQIEKTSVESQARLDQGVKSLRKSIADITGLNIDEEVSKK